MIIEAKLHHIGPMVRRMRAKQREGAVRLGINPHRQLHTVFGESYFRKSWVVDGRILAIGGLTGSLVGDAQVWLVLSEEVKNHRFGLVREVRRHLLDISASRELLTSLLRSDKDARRFALFLGFRREPGFYGELMMYRFHKMAAP